MSAWLEAVTNWDLCRRGLVAELKAVAPEYLDAKPADGARSAREIGEHLYQASHMFVQSFETGQRTAPAQAAALSLPAGDLADVLQADWSGDLKARLEALADRADTMVETMMFGRQTLLSQLWFAISHEWYHRGQVATYVRLSGGVPALTQFIEQRRAAMAAQQAQPT
jgi:uncharacterized damage-inducible protein DinB